jgi:hypothetical protein
MDEYSHSLCKCLHSSALKLGSWHGEPNGTVAINRPSTVLLRRSHSASDGQQESPGKHLQLAFSGVAALQLLPKSSSEKRILRIVDKDKDTQKRREGFKVSGAVGI